jgi:hypothetical protein
MSRKIKLKEIRYKFSFLEFSEMLGTDSCGVITL